MKKIAMVHITVNALGPMRRYFSVYEPDLRVTDYLDGQLMEKIRQEGGIRDTSMGRMLGMIAKACEDGNEGIVMTCTVFSRFQPAISSLFSVPVIAADTAMLAEAASRSGKTAIVYSFPGTFETTWNGYTRACEALGKKPEAEMILAEGAFEAAQNGHPEVSDQIVREKILALDEQYDNIALAQISLAGAAENLTLKRARVLTSPACAAGALKNILYGRE